MSCEHFQKITNFFNHIQDEYQLAVCIKDFTGFIAFNQDLNQALIPFLSHSNDFCVYIKSDRSKYRDCLSMISQMSMKSARLKHTFFGMCHAGLYEYVTPILSRDLVLGTINLGFFSYNQELTERQICRVCRSSCLLEEDKAITLYRKSITPVSVPIEKLLPSVELTAEYLSLTYEQFQNISGIRARKRISNSEDTILSDACLYIRQHFTETVNICDTAHFCHCSESYLSKIFQRRIKMSFSAYVNKIRIEASKKFLEESTISIGDIAATVGFNDPNYYSRVFSQLTGMSPRKYKQTAPGS